MESNGLQCHAITNKYRNHLINQVRKSGIWKMIVILRNSPRFKSVWFFVCALFGEGFQLTKFPRDEKHVFSFFNLALFPVSMLLSELSLLWNILLFAKAYKGGERVNTKTNWPFRLVCMSNADNCDKSFWITLYCNEWRTVTGLQCQAIKNEYRNHVINLVKNLKYEKWLMYKENRQDLSLWGFSLRVIRRSVSTGQIFTALWWPY